jgi:hypothetical protein
MSYTRHTPGECEAFRLLRAIVSGGYTEAFLAAQEARKLLDSLRVLKNQKPVGRPICAVTAEQLREIARLDSERVLSQNEIALLVGVSRANVAHHLRPSKAMMDAMLQGAA